MDVNSIQIGLTELLGPVCVLVGGLISYQLRSISRQFQETNDRISAMEKRGETLHSQIDEMSDKIELKLENLVREDLCDARRSAITAEFHCVAAHKYRRDPGLPQMDAMKTLL